MVIPRVLVGVLHVGEPGLAHAVASARSQSDVEVDVLLIEHLPKSEAHDALFRSFTTRGAEYDILVKLDADMRIVKSRLLAAVFSLLASETTLDHVILGVDDWLSGQRIQGIQFWRGGVQWLLPVPDLFTDLPVSTVREKWSHIDIGTALVMHAEDPTEMQALRYGAHRGLKAARTRKASRLDRLVTFAHHAISDPAPTRLLALAAVELALKDEQAGRVLVDGTGAVPEELLLSLRTRAHESGSVLTSVLHLIEGLGPASPQMTRSSPIGRLRDLTARLRDASARTPDRSSTEREDARRVAALLEALDRP